MDGETYIPTHKDIHDLSYVPNKYIDVVIQQRPQGVKTKCVSVTHAKRKARKAKVAL
jgi:hypothetical protein